jgi:hypothetical protein
MSSKGRKGVAQVGARSGSPQSQSSTDSKGPQKKAKQDSKGKGGTNSPSPPSSKKGKGGGVSTNVKKNKDNKKELKELTAEEEEAQRKELRRKYVDEYCTVLDFSFRNGTRKEIVLEDERFLCYSDLQRAIARHTPRSNEMYWCQTSEGATVDPKAFKENQKRFRIIELHAKKMIPPFYPLVGIKWDFYNYAGGAPPGWVDVMEVQRRKREVELEKEREREAAMKMLDVIES